MKKKYSIAKLHNLDLWKNFENASPQSSIFSSVEFLENFIDDLDLYSVSKGSEIKSLVYFFIRTSNL